ncbi:glycoside hydrolase domain-containing protein [Streptomyces noursei]|uniref:glycoside hydrolase domain-containing protein n=1 Tax=Streptomyces noursei TaxID=1971 RepID=UPI00069DF712|nr:glycoside hydrolase domain-containing protein [Streptomyces noursei]
MADEKVLEAQKWVNATYAGVSGYVRCPEDGRTGWSTMGSLTMGLQHELGISPVVSSFGPTTVAKMQALGEIGFGWEKNRNIVAVLEHALFCKGYWAVEPQSYGWFTGVTREAVKQLRSNMGIPEGDGTINAKIAKGILNMDAYVVVAGGTDKIRDIQQQLNGRYWQKDAFNIGPCDGIYSRDVQKALMIALQYELGLTPTGNYGPGTQAGLKAHTLKEGDVGIFVKLFTAACVFNEPVILHGQDDQEVRTTFTDVYSAKTTKYVELFQKFSQLHDSGNGDYETWSQLLVSMGDPDREAHGCDTRYEITESRAKWLSDNKYSIVGRYLYDPPGSTLDKEIKPGELKTIFDAGLRVFPIYQDNARKLSDFTYAAGYQHALNAHKLASEYGFNKGTTIYFACDYDATQEEIDGYPQGIITYFNGVTAGLASQNKKYFHGVYGSRNVCTNVTRKTLARFSFVSGMSWGFSGNLGFPLPDNWSMNQIKEFKVTNGSDTFDLDNDVWRAQGGDSGAKSVNDTAGPADAFIAYVEKLYGMAVAYGGAKDPNQLVMEYIRHEKYRGIAWWFLADSYDSGFVEYCNSRGMSVMQSFKDPISGYDLDATHLMATANGFLTNSDPGERNSSTGGDVAGWGGDVMTFYADWRNSEEQYASGHSFCDAKLAKPAIVSSFGFTDMVEDADGYLLAKAITDKENKQNIVQWVTSQYNKGSGLRRFRDHFDLRWQTAANCYQSCRQILADPVDLKVGLARKNLIFMSGAMLPSDLITLPGGSDKLNSFCLGFSDRMLALIGLENSMAATYKKNLQSYLKSAQQRAAARAHD